MSYVDLYPIRAGIAASLETSEHTSALRRIEAIRADAKHAADALQPVRSGTRVVALSLSASAYLELIDWAAHLVRPGKRHLSTSAAPSILGRLGLRERQWQFQVMGIESRYFRAIGGAEALMAKAEAMGQCWAQGAGYGTAVEAPSCLISRQLRCHSTFSLQSNALIKRNRDFDADHGNAGSPIQPGTS